MIKHPREVDLMMDSLEKYPSSQGKIGLLTFFPYLCWKNASTRVQNASTRVGERKYVRKWQTQVG